MSAKNDFIFDDTRKIATGFYTFLKSAMTDKHTGYKKLANNTIAILKILVDGINNEKRLNVRKLSTAKHRCSKAEVLDIHDMFNKDIKFKNGVSMHDSNFIYTVGEIVEIKDYDHDLENQCARGIHYFLNEECAFFYSLDEREPPCKNYTGEYKAWYHDGALYYQCFYKDGQLHGKWLTFDCKENKRVECYYVKGRIDGEKLEYYDNGNLMSQEFYNAGKKEGLWRRWDRNGNIESEQTYKDNCFDGIWTFYRRAGTSVLKIVESYKMGVADGEWLWYNWDGELFKRVIYKNGQSVMCEYSRTPLK